MTKKIKISKNSTETKVPPRNVFDEYTDYNKIRKIITTNTYADNMAQQIIDMARANKDAITMEDIYESFGIYEEDFTRLRNKYNILERAYRYALQCIGNKRFVRASNNKLNWNVINTTQWHYSKHAKEGMELRAALSKKEEDRPTKVTVIFPENEEKDAK